MESMNKEKISAVYKIVNTITGDCYVGSSKDVFRRWTRHKYPSTWKKCPNNPLYRDFQKYGIDKFRFQILAPVMPEYLKQVEQELIEMLQPTYNNNRADGLDVERLKRWRKEWRKSDKSKKAQKKWRQSEKGKEVHKKANKKYLNKICLYNGETLTLEDFVKPE